MSDKLNRFANYVAGMLVGAGIYGIYLNETKSYVPEDSIIKEVLVEDINKDKKLDHLVNINSTYYYLSKDSTNTYHIQPLNKIINFDIDNNDDNLTILQKSRPCE